MGWYTQGMKAVHPVGTELISSRNISLYLSVQRHAAAACHQVMTQNKPTGQMCNWRKSKCDHFSGNDADLVVLVKINKIRIQVFDDRGVTFIELYGFPIK